MRFKFLTIACAVSLTAMLMTLTGADSGIMKVSEVRPGMKGYGLTVFNGTEPERFDVEVVDVIKNALPKQDLVLIRVAGHDLENTGIYQGMSGSPIFIDGRILGALSYGWSYMKAPLAGITPIEYMIEEMNRPLEKKSIVASNASPAKETSYLDGGLVPLSSPVMVSGLPPSMMDDLVGMFKPYNLVPLQGGGGEYGGRGDPSLMKPGGAIAVDLVRGDIQMSAIGTISWVEGDKVLAFGHPFLSGGELSFPMSAARIIALLPRISISTKMGSSMGEVGTVYQDRQSGIVGGIGPAPEMTSFVVNVKNGKTGREEKVSTELVWETGISTKLISTILQAALVYTEPMLGENTADMKTEVKFKGYPPITIENTFFNGSGPFHKQMFDPIIKLIYNPFKQVEIESLNVDVTVHPEVRIAMIKKMWMEENELHPGDTGHLHVVLSVFGREDVEKVVDVRVSEEFEPGAKIMVGAIGGMSILPLVAPPTNFDEAANLFSSLYKSTDLVVVQQLATTGAMVDGFTMQDLPPGAIRMFSSETMVGPIVQSDFAMTAVHTPWVILGKVAMQVQLPKD